MSSHLPQKGGNPQPPCSYAYSSDGGAGPLEAPPKSGPATRCYVPGMKRKIV